MQNQNRSIRGVLRILPLLALVLGAATAGANPAMRVQQTLTQPDGSSFAAVLWGDEYANGWMTEAGYTVRFDNATGYWVYAVLDEEGGLADSGARVGLDAPPADPYLLPTSQWIQERRAEDRDPASLQKSMPGAAPAWASGTTNVLIIMVQFPADAGDPDGPQTAVNASFTAAQASANLFGATPTGPGNMVDYYEEVSYGALSLVGTVVGPYTLANDKNDYDDGPLSHPDMVAEAIALADGDVDYNDFDNDGDGWVDNVAVMYAGNGPDNSGYTGADPDVNRLWPRASSLGAPVAVDGINAQTYYIAPELLNSNPRLRTIGVYAHEFGHKLGLPDLYDTQDAPDDSDGIGHWCLMSTGSWCSSSPSFENGEAPAHMSAWCKQYLGWVTPIDLTGSDIGQNMPQAETNPFAVQLGANAGGPDDWPGGSGEYFLVENRQQVGFDIGIPGCGILVWHIDEAMNGNQNQGHTAGSHRLVDLEEADGLDQLDSTGGRGDAGDPFPGSTANDLWDADTYPHSDLYDGTVTNHRMRVQSTCGADMLVIFGNQAPVAACQDLSVDADENCQAVVTAAMVDDGSSDPDGDSITLSLSPAGPFPLGMTAVTLTVTDEHGEFSTCDATVTVNDVTPPVVTCPDSIEIECNAAGGVAKDDAQLAGFFAGVSALDNCDNVLSISNDAPDFFPGPCDENNGVTTVTFSAIDDAGNVGSCSAEVTVVDTTAPELEVTVAPQVLWPPNHKLVEVEFTVTASDVCDADLTWELVSVVSNEPDNGLGDGDTPDDIQGDDPGSADSMIRLRAERSGTGEGRVYTATFAATDCSGNTTEASANVYVPHAKNDIDAILAGGSRIASESDESAYLIDGASLWRKEIPVDGGESLAPRSAYLINTAGMVRTSAFFVEDVDEDQVSDVLLAFPTRQLEDLAAVSTEIDGDPVLVLEIGPEKYLVMDMTDLMTAPFDLELEISELRAREGGGNPTDPDPEPADEVLPKKSAGIYAASPNPFNPVTEISFYLDRSGHVTLDVYDISGRRIARLAGGEFGAGEHVVTWRGADDRGSRVPSGVYFVRMQGEEVTDTVRVTLIK